MNWTDLHAVLSSASAFWNCCSSQVSLHILLPLVGLSITRCHFPGVGIIPTGASSSLLASLCGLYYFLSVLDFSFLFMPDFYVMAIFLKECVCLKFYFPAVVYSEKLQTYRKVERYTATACNPFMFAFSLWEHVLSP